MSVFSSSPAHSYPAQETAAGLAAPTVIINDLQAGYPGRPVLTGLNLTLYPGEFVGLMGANGAGKTTLLRCLLGLVPADRGHIDILGSPPLKARAHIGYVPQKHLFQWDFPISVEKAVMSGRTRAIGWFRYPRRADWQAVYSALERTELTALKDRPVGELSGGQRQRVLLARALASDPRLLLLDEPFTGVDAPTQQALNRLYQALAAEGMTILMSTHDVLAARSWCSRIVGVRGSLALDAPAQERSLEELYAFLHGQPDGGEGAL